MCRLFDVHRLNDWTTMILAFWSPHILHINILGTFQVIASHSSADAVITKLFPFYSLVSVNIDLVKQLYQLQRM